MDFLILGPLELRDGSEPHPLPGARQRALLALLLLHRNEVVTSERLIDELWGESPPPTAAKALQNAVPQLRRALGEHAPDRCGPSAAATCSRRAGRAGRRPLRAAPRGGRAALDAGDPAAAAERLREALALWRGPPLSDLAYEGFAQPEIARLEEERLAALEDRIEADLALGRHAALVPELEAEVARHPLRERLRAQLMTALYGAGRQAEALEAFHDAAPHATRRARHRAGPGAARAPRGDPAPGPRAAARASVAAPPRRARGSHCSPARPRVLLLAPPSRPPRSPRVTTSRRRADRDRPGQLARGDRPALGLITATLSRRQHADQHHRRRRRHLGAERRRRHAHPRRLAHLGATHVRGTRHALDVAAGRQRRLGAHRHARGRRRRCHPAPRAPARSGHRRRRCAPSTLPDGDDAGWFSLNRLALGRTTLWAIGADDHLLRIDTARRGRGRPVPGSARPRRCERATAPGR